MQTPPESPESPTDLPFEQLLHHPEVVAAVRRALGKYGFREQDLGDGVHDVVVKALEYKGERPTTLQGTKRLCIVVAHRHGATVYRDAKRWQKKGHAGLTDQADESLALGDTRFDVVDLKKLLEVLGKVVPGHMVETFDDVAVGTPQQEIAAERGVPYKKVRVEIEKGRKNYRNALVAAGMTTLLAVGAWLLYTHGNVGPDQQALPTPSAPPTQVLAQEDPAVTQKKEQAAKLRQQAADACAAGKWLDCSDALDHALALDPAGNTTPTVQGLRNQADDGLMAKPHPGGMPPHGPAPKPTPKP